MLFAAATGLQRTGIPEIARNLPQDEIRNAFYHHQHSSTFFSRSSRHEGSSTSGEVKRNRSKSVIIHCTHCAVLEIRLILSFIKEPIISPKTVFSDCENFTRLLFF